MTTDPDFAKIREALEFAHYSMNKMAGVDGRDQMIKSAVKNNTQEALTHLAALEARFAALTAEPSEEVVEAQ